jgi:hypothetical protein
MAVVHRGVEISTWGDVDRPTHVRRQTHTDRHTDTHMCIRVHWHASVGSYVEKNGYASFSGDTRPCHALISAGLDATWLLHEATFEDTLWADARDKRHSTVTDAVAVAAQYDATPLAMKERGDRRGQTPPPHTHTHTSLSSTSVHARARKLTYPLDEGRTACERGGCC